ncbi:hypothetical protein M2118_000896 [Aurantimicrobium minutum]|uniref:type II toxin-antitoxin system RelE/ParE family toxin n=1 Tax=Aurantimicrobium minutum TaxID=708131 RepID=UPI00247327DA|nr:type II toxin-antitoxin system RelE/ParE family toxin [Aurantimicrobium minutum]MDH6277933.1 hypothetical protein [Aurantimicrobium minutum]
MVTWDVDVELIRTWFAKLDINSRAQVEAAISLLQAEGPQLGRPLVDSVSGSVHKNMKELRPGSSGRSELRILFVFDPERKAIMLVAGDKSGTWTKWYRTSIRKADQLYMEHLNRRKQEK